jgi:hypothetical protein
MQTRLRGTSARRSGEIENQTESLLDSSRLGHRQVAGPLAELAGVDRANHLAQHRCQFGAQHNLGVKARRGRRGRGRADDDGGEGEKVVGLEITAKRGPRWTRPRRGGSVTACTSPRTTQSFHHGSEVTRLIHVGGVLHQPWSLGQEGAAAALSISGLAYRLAGGFGASNAATSGEIFERPNSIGAESER